MSFLFHKRNEFTPQFLELKEEKKILENRYRIKRKLTQDDYETYPVRLNPDYKIGETEITSDPPNPEGVKESWDLFLNFYVPRQLIEIKMEFLRFYEDWTLVIMEKKLNQLSNLYHMAANKPPATLDTKPNKYIETYLSLKNSKRDYVIYSNDSFDAKVYAEYFCFYDFLINKIDTLYRESKFYDLTADQQIDEILRIFKNVKKSTNNRFQLLQLQEIMIENGNNIPIYILRSIVRKLEKDEKIQDAKLETFKEPLYEITFEGRKFIGYENETIENERKAQSEIARTKGLIRATWSAGIGAFCLVGIEVVKMAVNKYTYPALIEFSTFLFVFLFGIGGGLIIYQIVKHLSEKKE